MKRFFNIRWLAWIWLVSCLGTLPAQHTPYRQYTTLDGLPSNHVYTAVQDSRGILWIGTDQGVARFDGEAFRTYTTAHGLPTNDIFGIGVDKWDRVWFTSKTNRLVYIEEDEVKEVSQEEIPFIEDVREIKNFRFTADGKVVLLLLSLSQGGYWILCEKDSIRSLPMRTINDNEGKPIRDIQFQFIGETKDSTTVFYITNKAKNWRELMLIRGGDTTLMEDNVFPKDWITSSSGFFPHRKKNGETEPLMSIGTSLLRFQENQWVPWFTPSPEEPFATDKSIGDLRIGRNGEMWAYTSENHIIHMDAAGKSQAVPSGIQDVGIQVLIGGQEGNLWICTAGNGLIQILPKWEATQLYSRDEGLQSRSVRAMVKTPNGKLYLGNEDPFFDVLDQGSIYQQPKVQLRNKTPGYRDYTLLTDQSGSLYRGFHFSYLSASQLEKRETVFEKDIKNAPVFVSGYTSSELQKGFTCYFPKEQNSCFNHSMKDVIWWDENTMVGGYRQFGPAFMEKCNGGWSISYPYHQKMTALSLTRKGNTLWVGEATGLQSAIGDSVTKHPFPHPATIVRNAHGPYLWVATEGFGLFQYDIRNDTYEKLPEKVGPTIKALTFGQDSSLWVADQQLVHHITGEPGSWKIQSFVLPDRKHTPISLFVDSLVYIGAQQALYVMDPRKLPDSMPIPRMVFKGFSVNNQLVIQHQDSAAAEMCFPYEARNFDFDFTALSFWSMGHIDYQYRLLGAGEDWQKSERTDISFFLLPPGAYTFEVKATDLWGQESETIRVPFEVLPPWWKQGWFLGLMVALLLGILYLGFRWYQRQEKTKRMFSELQLQALQAQMNPHFVFNALAAIQSFILKDDKEAANAYLGHFSDLMRAYLYASHKRLVSIESEMEMLRQYLALQALRMPHPLTYEITADPELDIFQEIPALFLQPYVENAIQHGLLNKDGPGRLTITFEAAGEKGLKVNIIDDGIGMAAAEALKNQGKKQHISMGMQLVRDRKKMIELMMMSAVQVQLIDLGTEGKASGTRVEVYFELAD